MLQIRKQGEKGVVSGKLSPRLYDTARGMPGFSRWKNGELYLELTSSNLEFLVGRHPEIEADEAVTAQLDKIKFLRQREDEIKSGQTFDPETCKFPFKTTPYNHQYEAFMRSEHADVFGYFMEMGTGKTKVVSDDAARLYLTDEIQQLLIIAPNGVHRQWETEQLPLHMSDEVRWRALTYQSGQHKENAKIFLPFAGLKILSMNVESFSANQSAFFFAEKFLSQGKTMIVLDESSRIKNPSAERTKRILKLGRQVKYRRILSGTPVSNGVEDLYSQFMFLDPDILGFKSFYSFRNRFCIMGGYEGRQIVAYKNMEELTKRIDGHTYRVLKDDCLDLPEKIFTSRRVDWTPEQKKIYDELKKHAISEFSGEAITAPLAITRMLRFQQILSGYVQTEEGLRDVPTNRPQVLLDILEENKEHKTIVWCRFTNDIKRLSKILKEKNIGFVEYYGDTTPAARLEAIQRFQNDPDCRVFLGNPDAAGIGLNLTAASVVVWYSLTFNLEVYLQANDRCHRIGQNKNVLYVFLETPGSIDVKTSAALQKKKKISDIVLDIRELLEG